MESLHKIIHLMLEFLKVSFYVLHFPYYINDLFDDFIFNIAIYADEDIHYSPLNLLWHSSFAVMELP